MPSWTYSITIANDTDRTLNVINPRIAWGEAEKPFPTSIEPNKTGCFSVVSKSGRPWGIEFYFGLRDAVAQDQTSYGLINFSLDMPYWKTDNFSKLNCSGIFTSSKFEQPAPGAHDFHTSVSISTLKSSPNIPVRTEYEGNYSWSKFNALTKIDTKTTSISDLVPKSNVLERKFLIGRTDIEHIDKGMWEQISDSVYKDNSAKEQCVREYFAVSAYEVRKNEMFQIPANQALKSTVEVTNRYSVESEVSDNLRMENALNLGSGGPLSNTLTASWGINNLRKCSSATSETTRKELSYEAVDFNREVVIWEIVKVVAIFRETKEGKTELVGISDYHIDYSQMVYSEKP